MPHLAHCRKPLSLVPQACGGHGSLTGMGADGTPSLSCISWTVGVRPRVRFSSTIASFIFLRS